MDTIVVTKTDISVADATKKTAPNVITTAAIASASGSVAATSAPNSDTRTIVMKGAVRVSARARSSSMIFWRSEEHTSELQSHVNLVCRLLLEKKKNIR